MESSFSPRGRKILLGPVEVKGGWGGGQGECPGREIGHSASRAGGTGCGLTLHLAASSDFTPECHFLPEVLSEAPTRTGVRQGPAHGDTGQVVSQG